MVHTWKPEEVDFVFFTEKDLRRIHRSFGHPSIKSTEQLLKRSNGDNLDPPTRRTLRNIVQSGQTCKHKSGPPRSFKLTKVSSDLRFNNSVQIDKMYLDEQPVLHIVYQATHLCSTVFLLNQTSHHVWRCVVSSWSHAYCGPPDLLHVDQGTTYV